MFINSISKREVLNDTSLQKIISFEILPVITTVVAHHPADAELVGTHAEIRTPEGIAHRHGNLPTRRQAIEYGISFFFALPIDGNRKIIARRIPLRPFAAGIAAHQGRTIAYGQ